MIRLAAMLVAAASPATVTHKVEIDGKTYRVSVKGEAVEIADKSTWTKRSPERSDLLRSAATKATGCTVRDSYWEGAKLRGLLVCPATGSAGEARPPSQQ